jgi:hypothetical protein
VCDDGMDILLYSHSDDEIVYALERKKCKSTLIVEFINKFGGLGGFELILEKCSKMGEDSISLDFMYYYIDILSNCYIMINRSYFCDYLTKLTNGVKNKLLNATKQ